MKSSNQILNLIFILTGIILFIILISSYVSYKNLKVVSLYEFKNLIEKDQLKRILVYDNFIISETITGDIIKINKESGVTFWQIAKDLNIPQEKLQKIEIASQNKTIQEIILALIINLLPVIVIIAIFWYMFSQAQKGAGQIFSFSKSSVKMYDPRKEKITFDDIAGLKEAKEELKEVIEFLKNPQKFLSLGARVPKGVLLVGPPGTGKTLLAKATAYTAGVPFFYISGSEFIELFVGVGASRIRDAFAVAKKFAPSILFIDEIDSIGRIRGIGITGAHEEREQTLNQLLAEMDGFEKEIPLVVIGASVTGDTPVLVKKNGKVMLKPIKEIIDEYYLPNEEGVEKPCPDLEVLGFVGKKNRRGVYFRKAIWQKVKSVFRHKVKEIYIIEYLGGKIKATGNHSVFVRTKFGVVPKLVSELKPGDCLVDLPYQVNRNHKEKERIYKAEFLQDFDLELNIFEPIYKKNLNKYLAYQLALTYAGKISQQKIASTLGFSQTSIRDWIRGVSLPREFSFKIFKHKIPERIKVTPELMRLFGYYVAEGYARKELDFCFNVKETDKINDLKYLMKKVFGLEPDVERYTTPNAVNIIYYSKPLAEFFAYWCGRGAHNKHIPSFLFEAPKVYFIEFLKGLFNGDGYRYKNGKLEITSVSKQLILELNWLSRMHGFKSYIHSFKAKKGRRIKNGKPLKEVVAWRIGWGKNQNPFEAKQENKFNLKRPIVRKVIKVPYDDYVYDFCGCENEAFFGGESPILLHNTNRPDVLDPALLRPGRFDRKIYLDLPTVTEREEILKIHLRNKKVGEVNLKEIAERTPGFSGADIANLCNEAAIIAARKNKTQIEQEDLIEAIEKVMLGPERKSKVYSKKEKMVAAYHEAGHAIVAHYLPYASPVQKISIIARARAGGYTLKTPIEERSFLFKKEFLDEIAAALGGYASELIIFNDISTGASSDLRVATDMARELVTTYGMSEKFGPISLGRKQEIIYGYKEFLIEKDYSEKTAEEIDKEVQRILNEALERAKKVLEIKRDKLDKVAKALIKRETLEKKQFERLVGEPKGSLKDI
jgi:ATP-dependent Zn protease/transcriptional regulator with XRE-family HTH domain